MEIDLKTLSDEIQSLKKRVSELEGKNTHSLERAENDYITFMRSLGLSEKSTTEEVEAFVMGMWSTQPLQALQLGLKIFSLIHEVEVNGGKWETISRHDNI